MESESSATSRSTEISVKNKNKKKIKFKNILNTPYSDEEFIQKFYSCWRTGGQPISAECPETKSLKVSNNPFNCAFIPNILQETNLLHDVAEELADIDIQMKNNDLYKFKLSSDLRGIISKPNIQKLCSYIGGPLKKWVEKLSGLSLNDKVSVSCSKYDYSDVLLCHDDELEGRRIAFIFYLIPKWKHKFGGSLDLFSVDEYNRPYSIEERFYPKFNSFAFFEVSPVSFHQVAEILVKDVTRLSINGWFHGDPIVYPPRPVLKSSVFIFPGEVEEHIVYSWISPLYLDEATQTEIRKNFQDNSEIQLPDFLKKKKHKQLSEALRSEEITWKWVGPPNKRHLEVASRTVVPDIVKEFLSLMQSEAVFLILSQLTGLELHHLAPQEEESSDESDNEEEKACQSGSKASSHNTASTSSSGKSVENASKQSTKMDKKRKQSLETSHKKKTKINRYSEDDAPPNGPECSVGGLLDGWESDVEAQHLEEIRVIQIKKEETRAEVNTEIRRWRWGSYSLMRDDDLQCNKDFALEALMYFNGSEDWSVVFGGGTTYVAEGEEEEILYILKRQCPGPWMNLRMHPKEKYIYIYIYMLLEIPFLELLTVGPLPNCLALVYRDLQTFKFTKHINVKSKQLGEKAVFHEILCVYRELPKSLNCFIFLKLMSQYEEVVHLWKILGYSQLASFVSGNKFYIPRQGGI